MRLERKDWVDAAMRTRVGCDVLQEMDLRLVSGAILLFLLDDGHRRVVTVGQAESVTAGESSAGMSTDLP